MDFSLYRCHDYRFLTQRWKKVARAAGLEFEVFSEASGYELFRLTTPGSWQEGIYLSAGIHGDEPAGTEGLLRWAEGNVKRLKASPFMIFPCLNPWGVVNNSRVDEAGCDLNRTFHHDEVPHVEVLKRIIRPYRFSLAITLHEDYDGRGLYLYEVDRSPPFWGEDLLDLVRPIIPIEGRMLIDGRRATKAGIVRRKFKARNFPQIPEALYLHLNHSLRTFTFETPSEFSLDLRVQVQIALVDECVRRTLAETSTPLAS